jgi:hypothetical protein
MAYRTLERVAKHMKGILRRPRHTRGRWQEARGLLAIRRKPAEPADDEPAMTQI